MAVSQYSEIVSASNFTLTDSPSDTITIVVTNHGSSTFGYLTVNLVGGGTTALCTKQQMTTWGNETLTLSVDLDALYEAIPATTSDFEVEVITYDSDGTTEMGIASYQSVTGTIDTNYVFPTMASPVVGRYAGGSIHSDVYLGYGVLGFDSVDATPSRGATSQLLTFDWAGFGFVDASGSINTVVQEDADSVPPLASPVTVTYTDSRGLTLIVTLTDGTDFDLYSDYELPQVTATASRGSYVGGVWTANPIGDDVQVAVVLSADPNVIAEGHTVDIGVSIDSGAPSTQTVNADGTYYFYFTSVDKTVTHDIAITAEDDLQYGATDYDFTLGLPRVIWQPYADGSGFAFYATPKANRFIIGRNTDIDSLRLKVPLTVTNGGTGANSPLKARQLLGINYPNLGVNPIAYGGTGAKDAEDALANLNGLTASPARSGVLYANLAATGLVSGEQTAYQIGKAAPNNSSISWTHNTADATKLKYAPATYGTVTLLKGASSNVMSAFFNATSGRIYHWSYNPNSSSVLNNEWIEIPHGMGSAAMAQGVASAQSLTNSIANVVLTSTTVNPSPLFSFASATGAWICKIAGYVMASGQVFANGLTAQDRVYVDIARDRSGTVTAQSSARNRCYYADLTVNIAPTLIQVQSGDVIRLRARNDTAARGAVATGNASGLTVWYV